MYRRFYIMSEVRLDDFAHNVDQWIILNHAIVYYEAVVFAGTSFLHSKSNRPSTVPLLTDSFCREQSMITNGSLRKKVVKVRFGSTPFRVRYSVNTRPCYIVQLHDTAFVSVRAARRLRMKTTLKYGTRICLASSFNCTLVVAPDGIFIVFSTFFFLCSYTRHPCLYGPRYSPRPYLYGARYSRDPAPSRDRDVAALRADVAWLC